MSVLDKEPNWVEQILSASEKTAIEVECPNGPPKKSSFCFVCNNTGWIDSGEVALSFDSRVDADASEAVGL